MFDISKAKAEELEVAEIAIYDKSGEPTGIKIQVYSPDSEKYRKASMKVRNNTLKFVRKNNGTTAERIEADGIEILANVTVGWSGIENNGQPWQYSVENARKLYTDFPFIREQVDEFVGDRKNFING